MQAVPSLVGTGTAVAAAATGLVFGQPTQSDHASSRHGSQRRKTSIDTGVAVHRRPHTSSPSPSATNTAAPPAVNDFAPGQTPSHTLTSSRPPLSRYQRPQTAHVTPQRRLSKKQSSARPADLAASAMAESRDSISSNGSWIRRLSIRPLSQHGSIRSSIGPDSHSITFSHGSAAPILSRPATAAPSLPPNKLVKRSSSKQGNEPKPGSHRRSKSHLPSLRRPATSHQRSATLQHFNHDADLSDSRGTPGQSFDYQRHPEKTVGLTIPDAERGGWQKALWESFFHSKTARVSHMGVSNRRNIDISPNSRVGVSKRICLDGMKPGRVHLIKPRMVSNSSSLTESSTSGYIREEPEPMVENIEPTPTKRASRVKSTTAFEKTPPKNSRRSLSMTFSSAGSWVSNKASGSIRRPKRWDDPHGGDKRHVSDPVNGSRPTTSLNNQQPPSFILSMHPTRQGAMQFSAATEELTTPKRSTSSPLPPLSSPASLQGDILRLGPTSGSMAHPRPSQPSGSSTSSAAMSQLRTVHGERSSMMEGSDDSARGFSFGDDDDTDFKSDAVLDSLRTTASSRVRPVETPLESVYDESPPSTAGNGKTKRLSIQEILGKAWDEDNRIMEEEENTPLRRGTRFDSSGQRRFKLAPSPIDASVPSRGPNRLSLDDDSEEDWTKDDDGFVNPLSPPSKGSSVNSKGVNPNVRLALANLDGNRNLEPVNADTHNGRPLSNLFDWSEPSVHDKQDANDRAPRPRTANTKQERDARGGRSANRKGPAPAHVRSQSVPVVHDGPDAKSAGAKYGTWGIGSKTVSEDWDEDFEFNGSPGGNNERGNDHLFAVPESIRATQPSVKAHSGQIRELSLLVNDLKRLCRHGRDLNMLDGPRKGLWKEAEGIIALASPDEESDDVDSNALVNFEAFDVNEHLFDDGFDEASMDRLDAAFDGKEPIMSKTAVVRERHSPKRRSVFSPDDDIFGGNWPLTDENAPSSRPSRPRTPDSRIGKLGDVNGVVRTVMEAVQQRSEPDTAQGSTAKNRMHFDTNSLKVLVRRAGELRDSLSDMVRKADKITQSPVRTPRHDRHVDSSPAFTRVFDDPASSPSRSVGKRGGLNSAADETSTENSPSTGISGRMRMMMVG